MTDSAGRLANRLIVSGHMHRKRLAASLPPDVANGLVQNPVHLDPTELKLVQSPDHLVSSTFGNAINSDNIDSLKKL